MCCLNAQFVSCPFLISSLVLVSWICHALLRLSVFLVVFLLVLRLVVPVVSVGLAAAAFGALLRLRPVFLPHPPLCFLPRPLCARSLELATGSSYSGDVPNGDVLKGGSLSLSAPLPPAERPRPLLAVERCARPLLAAERCPRPCLRPLSAVCCFLPAAECRPRPCLRPLSAVCSQSDADVSKADVSNSGDDSQCAVGDGRQRWTMCNKACELRSCPHQIKDCYAQQNACDMRRLWMLTMRRPLYATLGSEHLFVRNLL